MIVWKKCGSKREIERSFKKMFTHIECRAKEQPIGSRRRRRRSANHTYRRKKKHHAENSEK